MATTGSEDSLKSKLDYIRTLTPAEAFLFGQESCQKKIDDENARVASDVAKKNNQVKLYAKICCIAILIVSFVIALFLDTLTAKLLTIVEIILLTYLVWLFVNNKALFGDKMVPIVGGVLVVLYALNTFTPNDALAGVKQKLGIEDNDKSAEKTLTTQQTDSIFISSTDSLKIYNHILNQKSK